LALAAFQCTDRHARVGLRNRLDRQRRIQNLAGHPMRGMRGLKRTNRGSGVHRHKGDFTAVEYESSKKEPAA